MIDLWPFSVNTTEAGQGDLDVEISCNGKPIRPEVKRLDSFRYRFQFVPTESRDHIAKISFNYNEVPGKTSFRKMNQLIGPWEIWMKF